MPLTNCSECQKQISDQAQSCPHCGHPLKPIVTEQTSKKWKLVKLISVLCLIIGMFMALAGANNGGMNNPITASGISLAFVAFIVWMIAKFGAWWSNR